MNLIVNGNFTYAELTQEQLQAMRTIEPEHMFVSDKTVKVISDTLHLPSWSKDGLRAIRNTIVKELKDENATDQDRWDMSTRISMIVAVIDGYIWKAGGMV